MLSHVCCLHMLERKKKTQHGPSGLNTRFFHADKVWFEESPLLQRDQEKIQFFFLFTQTMFLKRPKVQFVVLLQHSWQVLFRAHGRAGAQTRTHSAAHAYTHYLTGTCCSFNHIMFIPMRTQRKQMTFQQWKMIPSLSCSRTTNRSDPYQDAKVSSWRQIYLLDKRL